MQLAIISSDPIQTHVLRGVAERAGWSVSHAASLRDAGPTPRAADAVLVDVERVDFGVRRDLRKLATRVGRERLFLLTEQVSGVLPTPEDLGVHLMAIKPVHPGDFLRVVQASVATGESRTPRKTLGGRALA